jgi:hypothetical protein
MLAKLHETLFYVICVLRPACHGDATWMCTMVSMERKT